MTRRDPDTAVGGGLLRGIGALVATSWRESPARMLVAGALMVVQAVAIPFGAGALSALTDRALAGDAQGAVGAAVAAGVLLIAALTAGHFAHIFHFELGEAAELAMQRRLILLSNGSAGLAHHDRADYADRLQVLRQEVSRTRQQVETLFTAFSLAIAIATTAVMLALVSPWLLLLPIAAVPPLLLGRRAEDILAEGREASAGHIRRSWHLLRLAASAGPAKELRACGLDGEIRRRQADSWSAAARVLNRAQGRALVPRLLGQLIFAVAYIGATLLVISRAVDGRASVGDVILVIILAGQVNQQVAAAVGVLQELQRGSRMMRTVAWVERLVHRDDPAEPRPVPARLEHGIRLERAAFGYPGTDARVLEGVDLVLPAGSTVAIVGENGAGKTSLVKLLCRFYDVDEGALTVDGIDVREFAVDEWRTRISAGFQDFVRFELPARESIGIGELDALDDEPAVRGAITRARSDSLLERFDDGLDTLLGKSYHDGTELSGGQWQKVALARAMMRPEPLLLVLDEPTSALDAQAEHELFEQYADTARRVGERTGAVTVLVSHRFSTVRMADLIVVVAGGRIAQAGSHEELMAAGGLYAELYELQAASYR
ncbi:ABC transporter ATP-binding protein [Protaetiibacter sp. SSC-01]|uniref:ABC transporter ATP-binding protein n=1 Tax=Protaetiibacter sp. SSC-01 TaxID=2759943 RepID=UPI0016573BE8|nr:ABC transporter ATP-binding protein [Protaetiibacter sp. SSC-01]QNO36556.1 ABC transporter ATP-binding protein [Protaetiibacter sp. SSC-01]